MYVSKIEQEYNKDGVEMSPPNLPIFGASPPPPLLQYLKNDAVWYFFLDARV